MRVRSIEDLPTPRLSRVAVAVIVMTVMTATLAEPIAARSGGFAGLLRNAPGMGVDAASPWLRIFGAMTGTGTATLDQDGDGRITILLLASDSRFKGISRTDSMMIASLKLSDGAISLASIPRDTARIPIPGSALYKGKINAMVKSFIRSGMTQVAALNKFEGVVENLLRIKIDHWVVLWFGGLTTLVGEIDPITVNVTKEIRDSKLIDDHAPDQPRGVYFPIASNYELYATNEIANGRQYCNGRWRFEAAFPIEPQNQCHRALPYTRSRKGPGNNDWVREARQQTFVISAIRSTAESELSPLITIASQVGNGKWQTNMPISLPVANELYTLLETATLQHRVVFKPKYYATHIPYTSAYELKLTPVRTWTKNYMGGTGP